MLALIAALAVGASTAQAADVTVGIGGCAQQGGQVTVPAGSTITARARFFDATRGVLTEYLRAQQTTFSVNGAIVDLTHSYTPPAQNADGFWFTDFLDPTGITLANAGDSLTMTVVATISHPFAEEFVSLGAEPGSVFFSGPGLYFTATCTVTAA